MGLPVVWFEVLGKDGSKLQRFYGEAFGWSVKVAPSGYGEVETHGGEGIPGGIAAGFSGFGPHVTFYVRTPSIADTLAACARLGGKTHTPPLQLPDGMTVALAEDPEGHVIGLIEGRG
jgi:predicted enzyme related to lactoylglutathione lyase